MVADVSYARALRSFETDVQRRMTELRAGTSTGELRYALHNLGMSSSPRCTPLRRRDLDSVQGRAILCVRYPNGSETMWHWCAWSNENGDPKMLDPATQLEPYRIHSFLQVWQT